MIVLRFYPQGQRIGCNEFVKPNTNARNKENTKHTEIISFSCFHSLVFSCFSFSSSSTETLPFFSSLMAARRRQHPQNRHGPLTPGKPRVMLYLTRKLFSSWVLCLFAEICRCVAIRWRWPLY